MKLFRMAAMSLLLLLLTGNIHAQLQIKQAFPNLSFTKPLGLENPGDGSNHLFVVEQQGVIYVFENDSNVTETFIFLDIRDRVNDGGSEEGLLGLAFHPEFSSNGYFFVNYTASNPRRTVVSRFKTNETNPDSADKSSEHIILEVNQPYGNHNGGQTAFGPDGYLYISLGDGGSGGDPQGNGQNRKTLLGSILRIDVNSTTDSTNYDIPADNPFAGNSMGYREEIYAYGLRNPWRFSFDSETGRLWAGDVGQGDYEEVDIIKSGKNYGWNIMEGFHCFNGSNCDTTGLELPVWEYGHNTTGGYSITGGFIYRGESVPELKGKYVYADFVSGRIWALTTQESDSLSNELIVSSDLNISSFGVDANNELYICAFDGNIYRFKSTATAISDFNETKSGSFLLKQNYPNPFNPQTKIHFSLNSAKWVKLNIYNIRGQRIKTLIAETKPAGDFTVTWDGTNENGMIQPSGIYFYRLQTNRGSSEMKRMLFIK